MTITSTAAAPVVAEPLTVPQRAQMRERLAMQWRQQVDLVTDLAVRRHSIDDDPELDWLADALDAELSAARQLLVDLETEMMRLDVRTAGSRS